MTPMPNPFINLSAPVAQADRTTAAPATGVPLRGAAVEPSVSPGVVDGSLPSGESDPSVTLDYAPGESKSPALALLDKLGSDISDVGEIFYFARLLCARARLHPEEDISPAIVDICDDVWNDPPPLFLRHPYLR